MREVRVGAERERRVGAGVGRNLGTGRGGFDSPVEGKGRQSETVHYRNRRTASTYLLISFNLTDRTAATPIRPQLDRPGCVHTD